MAIPSKALVGFQALLSFRGSFTESQEAMRQSYDNGFAWLDGICQDAESWLKNCSKKAAKVEPIKEEEEESHCEDSTLEAEVPILLPQTPRVKKTILDMKQMKVRRSQVAYTVSPHGYRKSVRVTRSRISTKRLCRGPTHSDSDSPDMDTEDADSGGCHEPERDEPPPDLSVQTDQLTLATTLDKHKLPDAQEQPPTEQLLKPVEAVTQKSGPNSLRLTRSSSRLAQKLVEEERSSAKSGQASPTQCRSPRSSVHAPSAELNSEGSAPIVRTSARIQSKKSSSNAQSSNKQLSEPAIGSRQHSQEATAQHKEAALASDQEELLEEPQPHPTLKSGVDADELKEVAKQSSEDEVISEDEKAVIKNIKRVRAVSQSPAVRCKMARVASSASTRMQSAQLLKKMASPAVKQAQYGLGEQKRKGLVHSSSSASSDGSSSRRQPVLSRVMSHIKSPLVSRAPSYSNLIDLKSFLPQAPSKVVVPKLTDQEVQQQKEEELRRLHEKEEQARKRRDELARAKAEEKRLIREAREKKVQEARKAQEAKKKLEIEKKQKENDDKLEALNKLKEARLKNEAEQLRLEREQKLAEAEERRKKEEAERKRMQQEQEERRRQILEQEEAEKRKLKVTSQLKQTVEDDRGEKQPYSSKADTAPTATQSSAHQRLLAAVVPLNQTFDLKEGHTAEEKVADDEVKQKQPVNKAQSEANRTFVKNDGGSPGQQPESPKSYDMTPARCDLSPEPLKNQDDYDINDLGSEDETDDESNPRKMIPKWAQGTAFRKAVLKQSFSPPDVDLIFVVMEPTPDLEKVFNFRKLGSKRTSSAVWGLPPLTHKY